MEKRREREHSDCSTIYNIPKHDIYKKRFFRVANVHSRMFLEQPSTKSYSVLCCFSFPLPSCAQWSFDSVSVHISSNANRLDCFMLSRSGLWRIQLFISCALALADGKFLKKNCWKSFYFRMEIWAKKIHKNKHIAANSVFSLMDLKRVLSVSAWVWWIFFLDFKISLQFGFN